MPPSLHLPVILSSSDFDLPSGLIVDLSWPVDEYIRTLFLFTKSDFKTILFPVTFFACISAPSTSLNRLPSTLFWVWLHLLQFCVSNQSLNPDEDLSNKPWRPIPSQRISVSNARVLRWLLLPLCLGLSVHNDVLWLGIALACAFFSHNELGLDAHWLLRNLCNSWGYAFFNAGATCIASSNPDYILSGRILISFCCNALIIFTTIHAQDFRDEEGDKLLGRRTLPIVWPRASRIAILMLLICWSSGLSTACGLNRVFALPFIMLGTAVGLRFLLLRTAEADRRSYLYYNIWLATAQVVHLPMIMKILA